MSQKSCNIVPIITLDGPSGSGKGAIALNLSSHLGWNLLNSGDIYRVLAYLAIKSNVKLDDGMRLSEIAGESSFEFKVDGKETRVICGQKDVTNIIADEKYASIASQIAIIKVVRDRLLLKQKSFAKMPGLIAEGRDMGTVVFPDAQLKVFITAAAEERANRRFKQLKEKGITVKIPQLIKEILARDERDRSRRESPLLPHSDSIVIDTTCLSIEEVVDLVKNLARERFDKTAN